MADRAQRRHLSVTPYRTGSRGTLCGRAKATADGSETYLVTLRKGNDREGE